MAPHDISAPVTPQVVVLVEGRSDQVALEVLAARLGRDLVAEGVVVVPMGGAMAIGNHLRRFGGSGSGPRIAGLCDVGEVAAFRRGLERAGFGDRLTTEDMERLGFYVCEKDLEDELIRSLGTGAVEAVIAEQGEIASFRRFQKQPAQRAVPVGAQLRRFLGTHSGRKARYAQALVEALDLDRTPRPLHAVLAATRRVPRSSPS